MKCGWIFSKELSQYKEHWIRHKLMYIDDGFLKIQNTGESKDKAYFVVFHPENVPVMGTDVHQVADELQKAETCLALVHPDGFVLVR